MRCSDCKWLRHCDTKTVQGKKFPQKMDKPVYYCDFRAWMGKDPYRQWIEEKGQVYQNSIAMIGDKIPNEAPEFCPKKRLNIS